MTLQEQETCLQLANILEASTQGNLKQLTSGWNLKTKEQLLQELTDLTNEMIGANSFIIRSGLLFEYDQFKVDRYNERN